MTKTKTRKCAIKVKKGTLDQKHTERIAKFEKMTSSLPTKREKLRRLESELEDLTQMNPNKYTGEDIRRKAQLMDYIDRIRIEINSIENCTESLNYIVNTLPILVNYYDNEDIIDDGMEEEFVNEVNENGRRNILSYFMQENNRAKNVTTAIDTIEPEVIVTTGSNKKSNRKSTKKSTKKTKSSSGSKTSKPSTQMSTPTIIEKPRISRAKLYDNYLYAIDANHRKNVPKKSNFCAEVDPSGEGICGGEKILSQYDGCLVCKKCGFSERTLVITDKPSYKESTQDSGTYAYKRINHLTEILSQLQAKESTDIHPKVFESILREIKKRKINKDDLDIFRLRRILKKLNYRKYYEHVPHILQIINGKEPPNFSRNDEMKIKKMFKDIQKPFAIFCPKHRKNFLNYSYVLHKFCELLDLDEYISYFPLLKNTGKLRQHDQIWKNICGYMRWEFYKSI